MAFTAPTFPAHDHQGGRASQRGPRLAGFGLGVVVVLLAAWALWTILREPPVPPAPVGVSVSQIVDDPAAFMGKQVVVSGQVESVIGDDRVMRPGGAEAFGLTLGSRGGLLVVADSARRIAGGKPSLQRGDVVQGSGVVRRFDLDAVERELGKDLPAGPYAALAGRPTLISHSLRPVPVAAARPPSQITLAQLEDNRELFMVDQTTVTDATVQAALSPRVAALSEDVLLVNPGAGPAFSPGDRLRATGLLVDGATLNLAAALSPRTARDAFDRLGVEPEVLQRYRTVMLATRVTG